MLTNYTLSFDRTAAKLRGDNPDEEKWEFLGMDTAFATLLISCLVMVMMALVMFRMERHLRGIGAQSGQSPDLPARHKGRSLRWSFGPATAVRWQAGPFQFSDILP